MVTTKVKAYAVEMLGADKVSNLDPLMTSEDFAHYTQHFPCTYYRLGVNPKGMSAQTLHSSLFNIDEEALRVGAGLMAWLGVSFLK